MMGLIEYIGVGLVSSAALIVLAKVIMAKVLQRKTDFYEDKYDQGGSDDE